MLKKVLSKIPEIFLSILVAFSLTYALASSSLCLDYPLLKMLLVIMLSTVVSYLLFYNTKTTRISLIALGGSFAAALAYVLFIRGIDVTVKFFSDYGFWLYDHIMYPTDEPDLLYMQLTIVTLSIIVSIFSYIFVIKKFRFLVVLIAGMCLFGFQASYHIVYNNIPFYLFLLATLMLYLKHIFTLKAASRTNEYAKPSAIVMWSIPVSILIIVLSMSFHASDMPITWQWLDRKVVSVYNYFQKKFDYEVFDYFSLSATSGFGDNKNFLGGRVRLDRKSVMRVETNRKVYLSGASRDVYTGNMWVNSDLELDPTDIHFTGLYEDTDEMLAGMKILTGREDYFSDYFDANQMYVSFLNLKTKSLFKPTKLKELDSIGDEITGFLSDTGDLSSKNRLKKSFQYSMKSYVPRLTPEFEDAIRKSKKNLYEEYLHKLEFPSYFEDEQFIRIYTTKDNISTVIQDDTQNTQDATDTLYSADTTDTPDSSDTMDTLDAPDLSSNITITIIEDPQDTDEAVSASDNTTFIFSGQQERKKYEMTETLKALKEKSKLIYSKYLQLPDELPQRVKDLAASLTASADNDYDKAKAIEKYLAANYSYNLDVPSAPRDRDFVDYFLFDQKEGYCTYFASAMAVLARCSGLPARYVEGYMLPPEHIQDKNNVYIVTNMQAHAWVEIYFEGYGWLPFEATSPFRSAFYVTEVPEQTTYSPDYNRAYEDYMKMMMQYYGQQGMGGMVPFDADEVEEGPSSSIIVLICSTSLVGLVLLLILFNVLFGRIKLFNILNLPARDCVLRSYNYYLKVLKLNGFGLMPAETPHQYSERIDSALFFSPVRFKVITEIFVKSRYSLNEVTEKDKMIYTDFYQGFLNEIKISMGKFKFFMLRYILGRI